MGEVYENKKSALLDRRNFLDDLKDEKELLFDGIDLDKKEALERSHFSGFYKILSNVMNDILLLEIEIEKKWGRECLLKI